jgi:class 3 adenylate cyclase/tetratricopeptide (TPR) repeat protein
MPAERKLVTALFCDLVSSTALGERLDPEALQSVQAAYFDRVRSAIESFGGTVEKFAGDAVVAVFGVPHTREDDAERAVRAALAIGNALAGLNDTLRARFDAELTVRTGVATGEAFVGGEAALATGDVMNTAARLEQAAAPGEILVGRAAMELSRAAVDFEERPPVDAKGKAAAVEAWSPVSVRAERRRSRPRLVGRAGELELLGAELERAIAGAGPRTIVVLGDPGVGKSRLTEEFASRSHVRGRLLRGAAAPYGEGTTWVPIAEIIRDETEIVASERPEDARAKLARRLASRHQPEEAALLEPQLRPLVAAGGTVASSAELLWAVRRYLESLARERPTTIVLEDLHWADATLLETLAELVDTLAAVPLLVVLTGRPELRERIGDLLAAEAATLLVLDPLGPDEAEELATSLEIDPALAARAQGNPLFLEELATAAGEGADVELPRSLQTLVAARLDLLPAGAKLAGQAGSIVGEVFWDGAIGALVDRHVDAASLRVLRGREFVAEEADTIFLGQRQFRFRHALVRDVTYASVAKRERAEWHRRAAAWLEERTGDRTELAVAVAHHLESAISHAQEVAPLEAPDTELVERAVHALIRAAGWVESHAALGESARLLRRALELSDGRPHLDHPVRARLAHVLACSGDVTDAVRLAREVEEAGAGAEAEAFAALSLAEAAHQRGDVAAIRTHAPRAVELARVASLPRVEVDALHALGWADLWAEPAGIAAETWGRATEIALDLGDVAQAAHLLGNRALGAALDLRLDAAERWAAEAMQLAQQSGSVRALRSAHGAMTRVREFQGRLEDAVASGRETVRLSAEIGDRLGVISGTYFMLAEPLRRLGRLDEAWAALEDALRVALAMGETAYTMNLRLGRAEIHLARRQLAEAEAELALAGRLLDESDAAHAARLQAQIHAERGRDQEAERAWGDVERATTLSLDHVVEARLELAEFLLSRDRPREAESLLREIRSSLEGTGAELFLRRLRELEARLT